MVVRVAVIGDYQPDHETHLATTAAVEHGGAALGVVAQASWIGTTDAEGRAGMEEFDGIWIAPGSPYRSIDGALGAITFARTSDVPLLGTCAGFQHIVVEFARSVVGDTAAHHAEYQPMGDSLFVTQLSCPLAGGTFEVAVAAGSRAHAAYGATTATERYYCNFGLNPEKEGALAAAGLRISGRDHSVEARIVELDDHPFFVGTLFVPQVCSTPERPHPLVTAYLRSALERSQRPRRRTSLA